MATFDISRVAFDPRKHYSSVRMQQGRVLTDDDWNENERIDKEEQRRTYADVIGGYGSPDAGFRIQNLNLADGFIDFEIHDGTIYLGGIRLEMQTIETFRLQKDWLQNDDDLNKVPLPADLPVGQQRFDLVFLEAWQQPVSAVEDSSLFETALGGPDTTTRVRNMRRVKIFKDAGSPECPIAWRKLRTVWSDNHLGVVNEEYERVPDITLSVQFIDAGPGEDLCSPAVAGGYLGAENQAIRVQLTKPDHFTWGFDNAAPLYRVTISPDGTTVEMLTEPKDQHHWPLAGQVVEICAWSAVLPNREKISENSGFLSRVSGSYNPDTRKFTLATPLPAAFGSEWKNRSDHTDLALPQEFFFMRVWNRGADLASAEEIPFTAGIPVALGSTGLAVTFVGNDPVTEDFWVIAARPETPDIFVPWDLKDGISPHGIRRFFAPLAVVRWTNVTGTVTGEIIHDCRKKFNPLTEQECCCTYSVGDSISSKGDFNSIEEAIASLPATGGRICVLPGIHNANAVISGRRQITISGCGAQSIVRPHTATSTQPIFRIEHSQKICLQDLTLVTIDGIAIEVEDLKAGTDPSEEITIGHNQILALIHAIRVSLQADRAGNNNIWILYNNIGMFDKPEGLPAIFSLADEVLIERNRIVMVPPPVNDPDDPRGEDPPDGVFDPCLKLEKIYENNSRFRLMVTSDLKYVLAYVPACKYINYQAMGGIQVACASDNVYILHNSIIGGKGSGILLGHLPKQEGEVFEFYFPSIRKVCIQENCIHQMGVSGIGVFSMPVNRVPESKIVVNDLTIYRNKIICCALQVPEGINENSIAFGGIILAFCEDGVIQENRVEDNGRSHIEPVCGIFVLHGEKMDISGNRILNNGPRIPIPDSDARRGFRGGIVIRMSFKSLNFSGYSNTVNQPGNSISDKAGFPFFDAVPAVKLHDNIVTQPLGHAVFLIAYGPVSVVSNQLTSQGIDRRNIFSFLAGSVFILNLGISKDLFLLVWALFGKHKNLAYNNPSTSMNAGLSNNAALAPFARSYQLLPSGRIMFSANQTTLDLRSTDRSLAISSQMMVSLDDIGCNNNQSECAALLAFQAPTGGSTYDIVLMNTFLVGVSVRSNDNRFTDGFSLTVFSLFSFAIINTAAENQATHCLMVMGFPGFEVEVHNTVIFAETCRNHGEKVSAAFGKKTNVRTAVS